MTHIYNSSKLSSIPYTYQPDTIISKYPTKLLTKPPSEYYSIRKEDRAKQDKHALSYVVDIAKNTNIAILVDGFKGYKVKSDSQLFSSGVAYLIKNNILPTLFIKENIKRCAKQIKNSIGFSKLKILLHHSDSKLLNGNSIH